MTNDERRFLALNEMRAWINTPFRHQGRLKGRGVDCVGLALATGVALGELGPEDLATVPAYGRTPRRDQSVIQSFMEANLIKIRQDEVKPADLVLIAIHAYPMHVGIITDYAGHGGIGEPFGLLHSLAHPGYVAEQRYDPTKWGVRGYYRFRGLD